MVKPTDYVIKATGQFLDGHEGDEFFEVQWIKCAHCSHGIEGLSKGMLKMAMMGHLMQVHD